MLALPACTLLKGMAIILPARAPTRDSGVLPDLMAVFCWYAFRTRVVSSEGVRSLIERRCRGEKGDVCGVDVEYGR